MSLIPQYALLRQLKRCVLNLQNWKVLNPEDIAVLRLTRVLSEKIYELERTDPGHHRRAA
jgi:hypothetical protein